MVMLQALTGFEDDFESIKRGQFFHRSEFKAKDLESRGLALILDENPTQGAGKQSSALPVAPVSTPVTAKKSGSGAKGAGRKKTKKDK
jgi:hypothetical protein